MDIFPWGIITTDRLPSFFGPNQDGFGIRFRDRELPVNYDCRFILTRKQALQIALKLIFFILRGEK